MEIRVENPKEYSFMIQDKKINGIISSNKEEILDKLYFKNSSIDTILIDGEEISHDDLLLYKKKIKIVSEEMDEFFYRYKVYEYMYLEIQRNELSLINPKKKVLDTLKIVGLDITYLNRNIHDLSSSERKLLQLGVCLMANPEVIILVEPFRDFDRKTERRILSFLQIIKEQYDKTIVILSDDTNMLYQYADYCIIEKGHKILMEGKAEMVLEQVNFLMANAIMVPDIVKFIFIAKERKAKIDFHKDIRDLIKDIYKHV